MHLVGDESPSVDREHKHMNQKGQRDGQKRVKERDERDSQSREMAKVLKDNDTVGETVPGQDDGRARAVIREHKRKSEKGERKKKNVIGRRNGQFLEAESTP